MSLLRLSLLIILAFTFVTFSNSSQLSLAQDSTSFVNSFENLLKKTNTLSQSYHNETGKFTKGQYDREPIIICLNSRIWSASQKHCSLLNNTKMVQIYIQRALNQNFKVILISEITYLHIILLRINYIQNYYLIHPTTKLRHLKSSWLLDRLQPCHDK
jgi:hypothetical protein